MGKIYIKPEMETLRIDTVEMLAASPDIPLEDELPEVDYDDNMFAKPADNFNLWGDDNADSDY